MSRGATPHQLGPTTPSVPTGAHTVIPRREPSIVAVRQGFEDTFGGYTPPAWTLDAHCTQHDPEVFYPTKSGPQNDRLALRICEPCPVRQECLAEALEFETGATGDEDTRPEVHGTRGGMLPAQRRRLVWRIRAERLAKTREAVVADYVAGLLVEAIAEKHGVGISTVTKWAKADGAAMRQQGGRAAR